MRSDPSSKSSSRGQWIACRSAIAAARRIAATSGKARDGAGLAAQAVLVEKGLGLVAHPRASLGPDG
jgi:hypothetical protein